MTIPFRFRGEEAVITATRYDELAFAVFTQGTTLVLLVSSYSSSSYSTNIGNDKDTVALGSVQLFLVLYGGGRVGYS